MSKLKKALKAQNLLDKGNRGKAIRKLEVKTRLMAEEINELERIERLAKLEKKLTKQRKALLGRLGLEESTNFECQKNLTETSREHANNQDQSLRP